MKNAINQNQIDAIEATVKALAKQIEELNKLGARYLIADTVTEYMNAINRIIND